MAVVDVQEQVNAGITRKVTVSTLAPSGGVDGDFWLPGPPDATGFYQRQSGAWSLLFAAGGDQISVQAVAPASPSADDLWVDTSGATPTLNLFRGGAWVRITRAALSRITTAALTFDDALWKTTGSSAAGGAQWLVLVSHLPEARGTFFQSIPLWRALGVAVDGDPVAEAQRIAVYSTLYNFVPVELSLGRNSANQVLVAWGRGRSGLAAADIEVWIE